MASHSPDFHSSYELVCEALPPGPFRAAIFDFDGTLSLLRRNWQDVMIPMMVDELAQAPRAESRDWLAVLVEEFVMRLNGRQTIHQMIRLAEEVALRGGKAREPLDYKRQYHDLLWQQVGRRIESIRQGDVSADDATVPGTHRLLERLCDCGLTLYLASGTDLTYVRDEVALLGLERYFGPRVYGALDDYKKFSKQMVIEQIIRDTGLPGEALLGLGDGFVEIEEVKRVGGFAIGVASDEETRTGVNGWKRERLIRAGADVIVGDYREIDWLLALCQP